MMDEKSKVKSILIVLLLIVSVLTIGAQNIGRGEFGEIYDSNDREIALVTPRNGEDIDQIDKTGVEILETYPDKVLVEVDDFGKEKLRDRDLLVQDLSWRTEVSVKDYSFDITDDKPDLPDHLSIDRYTSGTGGLYLIHMLGPVHPDWRDALEELEVDIVNYVPNYAYEVEMTPEQAEEVEELFFVDTVTIYQPGFKLAEDVEPGLVSVIFSDGKRSIMSIQDEDALVELANKNDVYYIKEYVEPELHEVSTQIIGGGCWIWDPLDDPYNPYREHGDHGSYVNQLGYTGEDITMTVADSGIHPDHSDFQDRVIGGYSFGDDEDDWKDGFFHGTVVTGVAAGNSYEGTGYTMDMFTFTEEIGPYYAAQGPSYDSELYATKIFDDTGGWIGPEDFYEIVEVPAQNTDSYIHINSWGTVGEGGYIGPSESFDAAVRDADRDTDINDPMIITSSSGNEGPEYSTIEAPGTAKNVITVGSTENFMPDEVNGVGGTENPDKISDFSSRGWTNDNRIKPDLVAPGESLISTGNEGEDHYLIDSGTSFSNPNVAGAAGVVVEWYEEEYGITPSPSMVRALLINTAYPLDIEEGNTGPIPNRDEGWGMVNLPDLIDASSEFLVKDQTSLISTGEEHEYDIPYEDDGEPLKITLTWTDKEARSGDTRTLKNDLDLEVEAPDGDIYSGNAFPVDEEGKSTSSFTEPNIGSIPDFDENEDGTDDVNNVENVYIHPDNLESGTYTVRVIGDNVPADANNDGRANQDYSLVKYPSPWEAPSLNITHPQGGERWSQGEMVDVMWETEAGDGNITGIDLEYTIDEGARWETIAKDIDDGGKYNWELPEERTINAQVKATVHDDRGLRGFSISNKFTILGEPPEKPTNLTVERYMEKTRYHDTVEEDKGYISGEWQGASEWDIRDHDAYVGNQSWDFGDGEYEKGGLMSWLISPQINLTDSNTAELTFQHWRSFYELYDGGNLKVSTESEDGPWELIEPNEGYDGTIATGSDNPLGGEEGWGYHHDEWEKVTFDLDEYVGETIHLNWTASTEDWDEGYREGWRIDDIQVNVAGELEEGEHNMITWDASPDDGGGLDTVEQYNIYRSENVDGPWDEDSLIGSIEADGSSGYTYIDHDRGSVDDEYWWYVVRAEDWQSQHDGNEDPYQEPGDPEPTVLITHPEDGKSFSATEVLIKWEGYGPIEGYRLRLDENEWIDVGMDTEYIFSDLEEGQHEVEIKSVGEEGYDDTDMVSFVVDVTPPAVDITSPEDDTYISSENVTIRWTSTDDLSGIDCHKVRRGESDWINVEKETEYPFIYLADGEYLVEVKAIDEAGNTNITKVTFGVDTVPPNIEITSPENEELIGTQNLTTEWEGIPRGSDIEYYKVRIDDGEWKNVGLDTTYTFVDLDHGNYTVSVRAIDRAENIGEDEVMFSVEREKPTINTEEATDIGIRKATLNMEFSVGDYANVEVYFKIEGENVGHAEYVEDGSHHYQVTDLESNTSYRFTAGLEYAEGTRYGGTLDFITEPEPDYLEITPSNSTLNIGENEEYISTIYYEDGSKEDVTEETIWSDNVDPEEASSWDENKITVNKTGTWTITGRYAGIEDTARLTVESSLTINIEGEGSTDPSEGTHIYAEAEEITITATPDEGWYFRNWTGDYEKTDEEITITMDKNKDITANFEEYVSLTMEIEGEGAVEIDLEQGEYKKGTVITLETSPNDNWEFDGWTGDITGTGTTVEITMDEDKEITAHFEEEETEEIGMPVMIGVIVGITIILAVIGYVMKVYKDEDKEEEKTIEEGFEEELEEDAKE